MNKPGNLLRRRGFSLLELLAVMSIMAMLTTLAVTSYFAAINGMARRSAVKHVVNSLILARQRACMEGTRVSVMFFNEFKGYKKDEVGVPTTEENLIPSYVVCRELGRLSYVNGKQIGDEFGELGKMFGTTKLDNYAGQMRLYNLTHGGWWDVRPWVSGDTSDFSVDCTFPYSETILGQNPDSAMAGYAFVMVNDKTSGTVAGDSYGIEAAPIGALPRGFVFSGLDNQDSDPITINFLPDGRLDTSTGGKSQVKIVETRLPSKQPSNTVKVGSDGSITYGEIWN